MSKTIDSNSNTFAKRKSAVVPRLIAIFCIAAAAAAVLFAVMHIKERRRALSGSAGVLQKAWKSYDYGAVCEISRTILDEKPFNNTALTYYGYACFYLAVSQTDTALSQDYLEKSINALRLALHHARKSLVPQLEYMLGKAYFYKNTVTSYYYADLAVLYLNRAKEHGYKAPDISEYLGLSYAALGMTMESISAFTEALLERESDSLLLSIAEQYCKAGQLSAAKQYLFRIKSGCLDEELVLKSMNLLGTIYITDGDYEAARQEFESILKKNQNSADAYYGLGVIYEMQGDLVKARAEWRKAIRVQMNHAGALAKISDYK